MKTVRNQKLLKIVLTALMAALCYVAFRFLKINIPTPGGKPTALHIGNAFCVLCALLIGGVYGGSPGAIGKTISDPPNPPYIKKGPQKFVLQILIRFLGGFLSPKK